MLLSVFFHPTARQVYYWQAPPRGRFNRLIQARHGRAVVTVENGACTGCRTKLRGPLLAQLREKTILNCEACQRILYLPTHP